MILALEDFYFRTLKFCGCGNPEDELLLMEKVLGIIDVRSEENRGSGKTWDARTAELKAVFSGNEDFMRHYLYWLDALGLTEHGGSIYGSWLDSDGYVALELLRANKAWLVAESVA